jgi:hypothetical protein
MSFFGTNVNDCPDADEIAPSKPWHGDNDETPIFDAFMKEHDYCYADEPLEVFKRYMKDQELEIRDLKEMLKNPPKSPCPAQN